MDDRLIVSEVFRFPPKRYGWQLLLRQPRLHVIDWPERRVSHSLVPADAHFDEQEYRHLRLCYHYSGARGVCASPEHIFVALQNAIQVYDRGLRKPLWRIGHPLFNGLHEICWREGRLYVTCAVTDTLLVLTERGEEITRHCLGSHPFFLDYFGLSRRDLDPRLDYRIMHRTKRLFHVNTVQVRGEEVLVFFNRQGCLARITPSPAVVLHDPGIVQGHNAQFSPDGQRILVNDTGNYTLRIYDREGSAIRSIDVRNLGLPIDFSAQKRFAGDHPIRSGWLRGLAFSARDPEIVYVGLSPAMVAAIDLRSGCSPGHLRLRRTPWISVHGLMNLALTAPESRLP